jgi:hypothetical protein
VELLTLPRSPKNAGQNWKTLKNGTKRCHALFQPAKRGPVRKKWGRTDENHATPCSTAAGAPLPRRILTNLHDGGDRPPFSRFLPRPAGWRIVIYTLQLGFGQKRGKPFVSAGTCVPPRAQISV